MKTKLLLMLLLANFSIYAQYTNIPDVNFEKKLISLGIDTGTPDGQVLTSNISSISILNINNSSIADLTGIENFTALENLYATKNQLSIADFSSNLLLNYVDCSRNLLTSLNVSKNTKLTDLNVGFNSLTEIDLKSNVLLKGIDFQRNKLTNIDLTKNTKMTNINALVNQLTDLELSANTLLSSLSVSSNKLTSLDINNNIELTYLNCGNNLLTGINVSKNVNLIDFYCHYNQITNLDIKKNILIKGFMCHGNKLSSIDVSNNPELEMLDCLENQLTSLDISKNPKITELACEENQLIYLNLKNGNNVNLDLTYSNFSKNPNLTCIEVDDVAYSNANWNNLKDATATYASTCSKLDIEDSVFDKVVLYPNPTKYEVTISNIALEKATVYNALGQLVKSFTLNSGNMNNTISLSGLPKGVYYVSLINQEAASVKKVIVE
ncbi:T9SS type A sorting domain-containing protein [Flavobacterium piscis]|uniref:Secretion system C-terminal sorting domain-containing protein n=1 Tax=Flavobacterium piscis TaxID=1114874 RepID=A0ABU1Y2M2_9FLAO|nr:T9SS type A sorting domain-containing protein [Flavobacterium piscis]MDR7208476.1 hypothetical protein [Flavobacterium piscis]